MEGNQGSSTKNIAKLLSDENAFINHIFAYFPHDKIDFESEDVEVTLKQNKKHGGPKEKAARASSIEELRNRLHELQNKRLNYKHKMMKKVLKTQLKKKKCKEKIKSKKKIEVPKSGESLSSSMDNKSLEKVPATTNSVFNSEGKMVFSKFDFSELGNNSKKGKKSRKKLAIKDPKRALESLERQSEKLKKLKLDGKAEIAQQLEKKRMWQSALARAEGCKVKDDPVLLKKSIKKTELRKKKSKRKWEARQRTVEKAKQERQDKRRDNIANKKKEKKMNKRKKAIKKGKFIPGV